MRTGFSKFKFIYLLVILLVVFAGLYLNETLHRDLWGNLLATMIGVLLIDRIVKHAELQKSKRAMEYVKKRIAWHFVALAYVLRAPSDWRIQLNHADVQHWSDYYKKIRDLRPKFLQGLEKLLDTYGELMETHAPEFKNDAIEVLEVLSGPEINKVCFQNTRKDDFMALYKTVDATSAIVSKSLVSLKRYNLAEKLRPQKLRWRWEDEPAVEIDTDYGQEPTSRQIEFRCEIILDDLLKLRSALLNRYISKEK